MPIVLAIEPDRRQAAHLKAIVSHQAGAELLIADTTEGALDAIGNRVPDLVLVPALLSPQDDAALAAALRVIAVAAHVHTLTIPVLSSGIKHAESGGLLARWRRTRSAAPEPEGCDPAVFGEQIAAYLHEAAAQREQEAFDEEPVDVFVPQPASPPPVPVPAPVPVAIVAAPDPPPEDDADGEPTIDLSEELAELDEADDTDDELFDGERVGVYTIAADPDVPSVEAFDLLPAILAPAEAGPAAEAFVDQPEPPRADIVPWVPMYLTPGRIWPALEGVPAETPPPRTEQPDWIELVASLRQDLQRRRIDATVAAVAIVDPLAARPSDGAEAEAHRLAVKPKPIARKARPIQDEWGFFDPEQCGFSTLLAKLEEITEEGAGV